MNTLRDFADGDGAELGQPGKRAKIKALHSSSALACNFFDYWRTRDLATLAACFNLTASIRELAFEQKYPTGLKGNAPNLDVALYLTNGSLIAIESKFTEPFSRSKAKSHLKEKYFPDKRKLWANVGLTGCQILAENLRDNHLKFEYLDAAQLLKHMLGLASNEKHWTLYYLWYNPGGTVAEYHAKEITDFTQQLSSDSSHLLIFTYQQIFNQMSAILRQEHSSYMNYMRSRYFGIPVVSAM